MGAVLLQEGDLNPRTKLPTRHPIAYYSATFTPTERNYDIYERELLAVMKALAHWRPHLAGTKIPVLVLTDHANLTFWKAPRKVNRRVARWFSELQEYNLRIKHVPGKLHHAADLLSRPPQADHGETDNENVTLIDKELFIRLLTEPEAEWMDLERKIAQIQEREQDEVAQWKANLDAQLDPSTMVPNLRLWTVKDRIAIPNDEGLKREILRFHHNRPTAGHPGRDVTTHTLGTIFWWPQMGDWIANYVKGCARCQQAKNLTRKRKTPLYRIPTTPTTKPFQTVALDLITQLPKSNGYDAILTIVDHGCTRAALFLPCSTTITGEGIAKLYMDNVYRWFGMPSKVISDRDPRFTSHFARALTQAVGANQNLSTAFHPQTDGLSEQKNQWVEQYLRLVAGTAQDDWDRWLTIAMAVHNSHVNATTKTPPIEALLGYRPRLEIHQTTPSPNQTANDRLETIRQKQEQARAAIN
jgi:RNase H-like domain found in reverse transcriptase/Integrase zinc binding domain